MKITPFGRNVVAWAPNRLIIDGLKYANDGEKRFGRITGSGLVRDESGAEYEVKEGTWIMIGASRRIELDDKGIYLGVEVEEILGLIPEDIVIEEDFNWSQLVQEEQK